MAELDDWMQWKVRCARKLCEPDSARRLADFGLRQLRCYVGRLPQMQGLGDKWKQSIDLTDCFHAFEVHCLHRVPQDEAKGKSYKDWIFVRLRSAMEGTPLSIIEKGASLIFRDVARRFASDEFPHFRTISLDEAMEGASEGGRIIPKTAIPEQDLEAIERVYREEATQRAKDLLPGLSERERQIVVLRFHGLRCNDPRVVEICGVGKSQLFVCNRNLEDRLMTELEPFVPTDSQVAIRLLVHLTMHCLAGMVIDASGKDSPESPVRLLLSLPEEIS